ncbi:MAG: hypothetical protein HY830_27095, partial [Actinobacteria bacterium]|nr:hypothetical protein [Actinomycetota bacterium]
GSFDRTLAPGKRFSLTLERTGTVRYADPAHEGMFGALVVRAAPVSSTSAAGPLAGLPLRTTGAVAVLGLLGLLAGGRVLRGRYDLDDGEDDGENGGEDDGEDGRLLGAAADQDDEALESV